VSKLDEIRALGGTEMQRRLDGAPAPLRPAMQVSVDANSQELKLTKVIHLVGWLPPDPNDRSIEIAPEPD
jgi:hypothetical protein